MVGEYLQKNHRSNRDTMAAVMKWGGGGAEAPPCEVLGVGEVSRAKRKYQSQQRQVWSTLKYS